VRKEVITEEEAPEELSKTAKKKQAEQVSILAKKLSSLSPKQIDKLDHPEQIREELKKVKKIKSLPAKARHIKYVAKLMRSYSIDND